METCLSSRQAKDRPRLLPPTAEHSYCVFAGESETSFENFGANFGNGLFCSAALALIVIWGHHGA
eukprot:4273142-Amphidinium_carterae.1